MLNDASTGRYRAPLATYRLQLNRDFGFHDASRIVAYLARLGVSHVYLSPFFQAATGSRHGYDVLDHGQVNSELGGRAALYDLSDRLAAHGMGLMADMVPNHVGVTGGVNPWWEDVLRLGQRSPFAPFFDIDWEGQPQVAAGLLIFPILGRSFGETLEAGELRLALEDGDVWLRYFDHRLPIAPRSYRAVLGGLPGDIREGLNDPGSYVQFLELLDELERETPDAVPDERARLAVLVAGEPLLAEAIARRVEALNGSPGDPASFDEIEAILELQHYRLRDWRVSGDEVNYRRFFDINGLAAIRVERPEVFDATHRLLLDLIGDGVVTAVRVDHVDGLYDPSTYLAHLRERIDEATAWRAGERVPIYVEKILERDEKLVAWPVDGTSGYDFIGHVEGLFVQQRAESAITRAYDRFLGASTRFPEIGRASRRLVARVSFAGEVNVLAQQLHRIGQRHRLHRDHTLGGLRRVIAAVLASFPVYRTYISNGVATEAEADEQARIIRGAVALAGRADRSLSPAGLAFLAEVLVLEGVEEGSDEAERRLHFRRRFQQLSGPVMAKGMEDTAFYRYVRLLALNEVGGDPASFGSSPAEVHTWLATRAREWPRTMSATSTHDTKRSEDTRARLLALSEFPEEWGRFTAEARRLNHRHRRMIDGEPNPDALTEYYIYQTLVGSWVEGDDGALAYADRICEHLTKAMREAKLASNWVLPREDIEAEVCRFVRSILDARVSPGFIRRLRQMTGAIAPIADMNSLAMLWLKAFAPGVPDIYQGMEAPALNLTDPDNRRPVDFDRLAGDLEDVLEPSFSIANASPRQRKTWYTHTALRLRAAHREVFEGGAYLPVMAEGAMAEHVFAFARETAEETIVVAVPRLARGLVKAHRNIDPAQWANTRLRLPYPVAGWRDLLTGEETASDELQVLLCAHPLLILHGWKSQA